MSLADIRPPAACDQAAFPEILKRLQSILPSDEWSLLVYGSRARGEARPDSDLDVLLFGPGENAGSAEESRFLDNFANVCRAFSIRGEYALARESAPDFIARISGYGIPVLSDEDPELPDPWPPEVEQWSADDPPSWIAAPLRHACENFGYAASEIDKALDFGKDRGDGDSSHLKWVRDSATQFCIFRAMRSVAKGFRRLLVLVGEDVADGIPGDDRVSLAIVAAATRPAVLWHYSGSPLRPAFGLDIRGPLLSLADLSDHNSDLPPSRSETLTDTLASDARAIVDRLIPAYDEWLRTLGTPENTIRELVDRANEIRNRNQTVQAAPADDESSPAP